MPHVELSLTDGHAVSRHAPAEELESSLERWAAAVVGASEPCLIIDPDGTIVAVSASCAEIIGVGEPAIARGRELREAANPFVDFTAARERLDEAEAEKIPPLLAISSGRMARGLIRMVCPISGYATTLDAISTPLTDGATVVGSLTFVARV